ncbi:DUF3466 family protein [Crenothrix polyspora]|uniref:Extracellular repeat protein, HAF family n=1 Tax=Crenothrix polyspora TaxID=360316 RepID=A0A1R4H2C2_9GAMM|nr:DUF3466 family protein [Crenothrix polyspora]SJM90200.1 hypothetical protein CRENPOLYSF1_1390003 [Crenothrix polyspora]
MTYPTAFITNTKGIINSDTSYFTEALSINTSGQVAGYFQAHSHRIGAIGPYAVLVTKNKVKNLDTLGSQYSFAYDVNDKGEVTGYRAVKTGGDRAFVVTSKGVMKDLPSDTGVSATYAYAINNKSQVAGYASTHVGDRAFVTLNGAMKYLGVLGGFYSKAYGLNDKGQVVGLSDVAYNSPYTHAFVTVNGVMKDLGALRAKDSSTALGINSQGQIVGYSSSDTKSIGNITGWSSAWMSVADRAFVTIKGKMTDLNSLIDPRIKWTLARANAINDQGQITGVGINPKGVRTAFLLSPIKQRW